MDELKTEFTCPRRSESHIGSSPAFVRDNDYDASDDSCGYCGSLNPDTLMARLEEGSVQLGSTDKNYKVYVTVASGAPFKQTYRDCPRGEKSTSTCKGPKDCTHWVTRETDSTKFYFQHLSDSQRARFIALYNEGRLKFDGGMGFYVLPFFCRKEV